ncbi:hypothetical protein NC652_017460 [Populus alba x Populus x berolinensis]|nr:hypothetical protein NC652_017460 [Populus alba x Populus x berolinensis]
MQEVSEAIHKNATASKGFSSLKGYNFLSRTMKCERCCFHGKRWELIALDVHGVCTKFLSFIAC